MLCGRASSNVSLTASSRSGSSCTDFFSPSYFPPPSALCRKRRGEDEGVSADGRAYRDFTGHAAAEVASGVLDTWLEDGPMPGEDDSQTSDSGN